MINKFIVGGSMIGLGASLLLLTTGYISGMNSMLDTIFVYTNDFQYRWKALWLSVFIVIGIILSLQQSSIESLQMNVTTFISFFILAFGVRMAKGCTSGHGINGIARLSKRSIVAVITFFSVAMVSSTFIKSSPTIVSTKSLNKKYIIIILIVLLILWNYNSYKKTISKDHNKQINIKNYGAVIISALLFSYGIIYSGMHKYSVVKQTLTYDKDWKPNLIYVFISAVIIATIGIQGIIHYRNNPIIDTCEQSHIPDEKCDFMLPKRNTIDSKLLIGSGLFGLGWGLTKMCPSTFPIRLGIGDPSAYLGLVALYLGYQSEYIYENIREVKKYDNYIFHQFFDPPSSSFTYIVGDINTNEVVIIDSVYNNTNHDIPTKNLFSNFYYVHENIPTSEALILFCDMMGYNVKYLINTHIHVDHITANDNIKKIRYIPSIIGNYPDTKSDYKFENMKTIEISNELVLEPFKTPGHTENCYSLLLKMKNENILFTGDALLITGVGRTDLDSKQSKEDIKNNKEKLFQSLIDIINRLEELDNDTLICPAHDYREFKTIYYSEIKSVNPFLDYIYRYLNEKDNKNNIKEEFIKYFEDKELTLAKFWDYDINLCVHMNKMCGVTDNIRLYDLERIWTKSSGACG